MKLVPRELDKLGLQNAGFLAQKRLARGLRLNHPEAVALIATQVFCTFVYFFQLKFSTLIRYEIYTDNLWSDSVFFFWVDFGVCS